MSSDLREFADLIATKRIYVQVIVPQFGLEDFKRGEYTGWYVGHASASQLDDDVITKLHAEWFDKEENSDGEMEAFMHWLGDTTRADWQGHIVFYSAQEGISVIKDA